MISTGQPRLLLTWITPTPRDSY